MPKLGLFWNHYWMLNFMRSHVWNLNLVVKWYLWSTNIVSKNQNLVKTTWMGSIFTVNRSSKSDVYILDIASYTIFYQMLYSNCTFEKNIFFFILLTYSHFCEVWVFTKNCDCWETLLLIDFYPSFFTPFGYF